MVKDLVFFGDNGLTSTSANHIANLAKEYIQTMEAYVNGVGFLDVNVKLIDANNDNLIQRGMTASSLMLLPDLLHDISMAKSLIAWLREAITAKEDLLADIQATGLIDWMKMNDINLLKPVEGHVLTEKEYYASLPIKERNRYYQLETVAAVIGKYIHPDGPYSKARKEANNIAPHKIEGSGRDTLIYTYTHSVFNSEIDSVFFELQKKYREAQAQLNAMKHDCQIAIDKSNNEVMTQYDIERTKYNNECDKLTEQYKAWKDTQFQKYSNLKIVIPDSLQNIYKKINSLGKTNNID